MAIIRPSNLQTVAPQAAPNAMPQANADIASFGGTQARDTMVAGQQLEKASDSLGNIALAEMKDANETRVQDLNNQFINGQQAALYTAPDAFYRLKGADAINGAEKATDKLIELKKQTIDGAANPYQRQRLSAIIDSHFNSATTGISRHVVSEQAAYDKNVDIASIDTATQSAILDPSQLPFAIERARGAAASISKGQSAEVIANAQLKAESDVYSGVIRHKINMNDTTAIDLYKKYGDRLDVKDRERIEPAIKTMQTGATARVQAREFMGAAQGPAVGGHYDNNIGNITVSKFQYSGGKGAPNGSFETFTTPEHGVAAAYTTIKAKADQNGGSISFIDLIGGNITRGGKVSGWAEKDDGKTALLKGNDPNSYAYRLATSVGLKPGDMVPLGDDAKMETVLRTMNAHEKGKQTVKDDAFMRGIKLAKGDTTVLEGRDGPATDKAANADPLYGNDNVVPSEGKNGATYKSSKELFLEADRAYEAATKRNNETNNTFETQSLRTTVQALLKTNLEEYKRRVEIEKMALEIKVDKWMTTGGGTGPDGKPLPATTRPDAETWNDLSWEKQKSIDATLEYNARGKNAVTDWGRYYEIQRGLTSVDPNERAKWADYDLLADKPNLANEQFTKLSDMQGVARKGDPDKELSRVASNQKMIDERLNSMNIYTSGPKATLEMRQKEIRFNEAVQDRITQLEKAKPGHKATFDEVTKILKDLTYEVIGTADWFGLGSNKRAFEVPNPDPSKFVVKMSDISKSDTDEIAKELKKEGIKQTEENIIKRYKSVMFPAGKP